MHQKELKTFLPFLIFTLIIKYGIFFSIFLINIIELKYLTAYMAQYMSGGQKGIGRNARGAKHQAVVERTVA